MHSRGSDGRRSPARYAGDRNRDRDYDGPSDYDRDRRGPPPPRSYRGGPSERDYGPERDERGYGRSRGPPGRSRSRSPPPYHRYDSRYDEPSPPGRGDYRRSYGGRSRSPSPPPRSYRDSRYDSRPRSPPPRRPRSPSPPPRSYDYHPPLRSYEASRPPPPPPPRSDRESYPPKGRSPSPRRRSRSPVTSRSGYSTAPRSRDRSPPAIRSRRDSISNSSDHDRRRSRPDSPEAPRGPSSQQTKYASGPGPVPTGPRGIIPASLNTPVPTGPRAATQRAAAAVHDRPSVSSDGKTASAATATTAARTTSPSAPAVIAATPAKPPMTQEQIVAAREAQARQRNLQRSAQAASKWLPSRSAIAGTRPPVDLVDVDKEVNALRSTRLGTLMPALMDASAASTKAFLHLSNQMVEKDIAEERTRVTAGSGDLGGSVATQMGLSPARDSAQSV